MDSAATAPDIRPLLISVAPVISEGLGTPAVAELADPVVSILLDGEGWDSPARVYIGSRWDWAQALAASGGQYSSAGVEERPPDSLLVSVARGGETIRVDACYVPDPRIRPDWWGLDPAGQAARPALRLGSAVRRGLAAIRPFLGRLRG